MIWVFRALTHTHKCFLWLWLCSFNSNWVLSNLKHPRQWTLSKTACHINAFGKLTTDLPYKIIIEGLRKCLNWVHCLPSILFSVRLYWMTPLRVYTFWRAWSQSEATCLNFYFFWDIPTNRSISPRPRWKPMVVLLIMIKSGMTYLGEMTIVTLAVLAFQRWHWTNILWKVLKKSNRIMEMKPFNNFLSVLCIIEENYKLCYLVQNLFMSLYISL